jgi:very-short-patch-repair endonuclease
MELVKRPDVVLRNKSLRQRTLVSNSWNDPNKRQIRIDHISKANKGKRCWIVHPMLGKKHTPESIQQMKKTHAGKKTWFNYVDKNDPKRVAMYRKSAITRKERGSQAGKNHFWYGKKRPEAGKKIIETMLAGKMKRVFNTKPELKMKEILESKGIKYLFQQKIGGFMTDFLIKKSSIIIEVDGEYWHNYPLGRDKDRKRDLILSNMGYKVIRFWANDVLKGNVDLNFLL